MKQGNYSENEYLNLKNKYGSYSSWAIWDDENESDTNIIDKSIPKLNSKYVLVGLNAARPLKLIPWINFHGGKHDRKIKYACNDNELRGSYITDLFKNLPETVASKLDKRLTDSDVTQNVEIFRKEMEDIKLSRDSKFIIFGRTAEKYFVKFFKKYFDQPYICTRHYSDFRLNDGMWVKEFLGNISNI